MSASFLSSSKVDTPTTITTILLFASFIWTAYIFYDSRRRSNPPSALRSCGLFLHNSPAALLLGTTVIAQNVQDPALLYFKALLIFRYWRTLVNVWFWFQYKPAVATADSNITSKDCTVIVPVVDPRDDEVFDQMVAAILVNCPASLIFSTNTVGTAQQVEAILLDIREHVKAGTSTYQTEHCLNPMVVTTETWVRSANISNKRKQVAFAIETFRPNTKFCALVDQTSILGPCFLTHALPGFQSENVGLIGTNKWVVRLHRPHDPEAKFIVDVWKRYVAGFWNAIGGLYLVRHNFEIRATNAADGGVFCVSGRTLIGRSRIFNDECFRDAFVKEYVWRWGPLAADDDNFITRWVIKKNWDIKIQCAPEATVITTLGTDPQKFLDQCKRWSRTTFRQNPKALFCDRTIWWKWPLTVWTTYIPWMYNAALFWDGLAMYTLVRTELYAQSAYRAAMVCSFIAFIWVTKLVKTIPWFWEYPMDFLLYFVIPTYPLFTYWHSLLKVYTALTFWDITWSGRQL
jgi:hypothetical protein